MAHPYPFLIVNEKPQSGLSARCLPVPPIVVQQRALYEKHRQFVLKKLGLSSAPRWFYIEPATQSIKAVGPAQWSALMYPVVANALRHSLAHALRSWPGDRLDLLLGHHPKGAEPGDPGSAIEPAWTKQEVDDINEWLVDLGFEAIRGCGRG